MQAYLSFVQAQKTALQKQIAVLEREGRQDEANLNKVRLNIVTVFETVLAADQKQSPMRYETRFETLSAPWKKRLEQARAHGDHQTIAVEETKIETMEMLRRAFQASKE